MSEVLSLIWLRDKMEPSMPKFRLSAHVGLAAGEKEKLRVTLWMDEIAIKLIAEGRFDRG